jgi:hypothetical protein
VHFCCSVGCLCQGLQGFRVVSSCYNRLVSRWCVGERGIVFVLSVDA